MATVAQVAVIVAQDGAETAPSVDSVRRDGRSVVLLHQEPGESLPELGHRVRARLATLLAQGYRIHSATFVARYGFGLGDVLATANLLRALLAAMVAVGSGQVFLHADSRDIHARLALTALADAIGEQVRGTGVEVVMDQRPHEPAPKLAAIPA